MEPLKAELNYSVANIGGEMLECYQMTVTNLTAEPVTLTQSWLLADDGRQFAFRSDLPGVFSTHRIPITLAPGEKAEVSVTRDLVHMAFTRNGGPRPRSFRARFTAQGRTVDSAEARALPDA